MNSSALYLSLYIKTDKTDLEYVAGPQLSYPKVRGLGVIYYEADFIWPRGKGKYQIVTALSRSPNIPPTNFQQCGKRSMRKDENVHIDWPMEFVSISTGGQ